MGKFSILGNDLICSLTYYTGSQKELLKLDFLHSEGL